MKRFKVKLTTSYGIEQQLFMSSIFHIIGLKISVQRTD